MLFVFLFNLVFRPESHLAYPLGGMFWKTLGVTSKYFLQFISTLSRDYLIFDYQDLKPFILKYTTLGVLAVLGVAFLSKGVVALGLTGVVVVGPVLPRPLPGVIVVGVDGFDIDVLKVLKIKSIFKVKGEQYVFKINLPNFS